MPIEGASAGAAGGAPGRRPDIERPAGVEPFALEEPEAPAQHVQRAPAAERQPASKSVKDFDICPNCGASMRGADELVCLRCGFDLKTLKVLPTVTAADTGEQEVQDQEGADAEPLVAPGLGNLWLPGALAAISAVILIVSYLAGAVGLFPHLPAGDAAAAAAEVPLGARFEGLLQFVVLSAMWIACGLGALAFLAYLVGRPFGDLQLALVRMTAVVVTMRLASMIDLGSRTWEWTAEALLQAAIFIALAIALFRLQPRDAPTLGIAAVILFMVLWLGANVVVWVTV